MKKFLHNFHNEIKKITEPNHKKYPDATVRQFTWNRNIAGFYIALSFLLFSSGLFCIPYLTFSIRLTILIINICVPIVLVLLCRSYMWLFSALYATMVLIYTSQSFDNFPDAPYVYCGYIHVVIACSLLYGGDLKVVLCSGFFHMILCLTKFRAKLLILVQEEDPQVFADKFAGMVGFFIILKLLIDISLVSTLDRRTIELLRVKKDLESALEQQKTFIFSFSHELRNPINSLLGNLQLVLQGETLSSKAAEMINIAKVCGEILLHNINNMLDTGKHEIGKLEVNPISTQVNELFQRTWSIYCELLSRKKLRGQLRLAKDLPASVKIDSQKVNQILLNLIGNSIKFTEKGSITVTVNWLKYGKVNDKCFEPIPYDDTDEGIFEKEENLSAISFSQLSDSTPGFPGLLSHERRPSVDNEIVNPVQESKGVLKIIVKDTGSGMKKEALEKLFKKFSQVSEDASQRQIGTGLGLFITKEICTIMKGEIRAYSKPGVGSTFIVCIPTTSLPLDNVQKVGSELIIHQLKQKQLKALVADDSPFNVNLTCNYFTQLGASVVSVAYTGYDAFLKYKEARLSNVYIDIIAMDIDMPIMDGRTACDKIRQYERENRLKPTVILLISGNYDKEQIDEYINAEQGHRADYFLRKPVSYSEFNRAVYNLTTH